METNFLDLLGDNADGQLSSPTAPPPTGAATSAPASTKTGPSILDLLSNTAAAPPNLPQADLSSLLPMTLLQFAAGVTQPRARGQSTMGQVLQSVAGAAAFNMNTKKQIEDRATEQEFQRRKLAATDAALEQARLGNISARQSILGTEEKRPLELQSLKLAIEKATGDVELNGLKVRAEKLKATYAERVIQSELDERAAKTDAERSKAMLERAQAEKAHAEIGQLLEVARVKAAGANKPVLKLRDSLDGPASMVDERSGAVYYPPMRPEDAMRAAEGDVKGLEKLEPFASKEARASEIRRRYQTYIKGTLPVDTGVPGGVAPSTPAPGATAPKETPTTPKDSTFEKVTLSAARMGDLNQPEFRNKVIADDITNSYWYNGQQISKNKAMELHALDKAGGKPGQPATQPVQSEDATMNAQMEREFQDISKRKRTDYSPEVKVWLARRKAAGIAADQQLGRDERNLQLERSRALARGE